MNVVLCYQAKCFEFKISKLQQASVLCRSLHSPHQEAVGALQVSICSVSSWQSCLHFAKDELDHNIHLFFTLLSHLIR